MTVNRREVSIRSSRCVCISFAHRTGKVHMACATRNTLRIAPWTNIFLVAGGLLRPNADHLHLAGHNALARARLRREGSTRAQPGNDTETLWRRSQFAT